MRFTVRLLLFIVVVFSALFAITARYPPIGVACFSFVPLAFLLLLRRRCRQAIAWQISMAALATLPIYVASSGPFNMFVMQYTFTEASLPTAFALKVGHVFYVPLNYAIPSGPIGNAYEWYIGEWMEYGVQRVFGPLFDLVGEDFPDL
ncbi:MAG: hypothetical protein NXI28_21925 [bacterium]|jgi:hypothetical protein|nr:hypothetical protein [bacterium]